MNLSQHRAGKRSEIPSDLRTAGSNSAHIRYDVGSFILRFIVVVSLSESRLVFVSQRPVQYLIKQKSAQHKQVLREETQHHRFIAAH